jgi:hypothetical protein
MTLARRWWLNLVLVGGIAGLGALAYFEPGREDDKGEHQPFAVLEDAAAFRIENTMHGETRFERDGEVWSVVAPFRAPADANILRTLLDGLAARTDASFPSSEVDLAAAGLERPKVSLVVGETRFAFGGTAPISYRRYVRSGDTVFLVEELNHYRLDQPSTYFARRKLLPDEAEITRLELPGRTLSKVDGKWTLAPEDAAVSADAIQRLVDAWRDATAMEVRVLAPDATPQGVVQVTLADGSVLAFEILTSDEYTRLARRDQGLAFDLIATARKGLLEVQRSDPAAALTPDPKP